MDWTSCSVNGVPTLACLPGLFQNVVSIALGFVGIVALFFIMWGGIKFILSRGDAKQAQGARQIITYAIIGLIIVVSAFFIVNFLATVTGLDCIKKFGIGQCRSDQGASSPTGTIACYYNNAGIQGDTGRKYGCWDVKATSDIGSSQRVSSTTYTTYESCRCTCEASNNGFDPAANNCTTQP